MTIEQLRAQSQKVSEMAIAQAKEAAERRQLTASIQRLSNPAVVEALGQQYAVTSVIDRLSGIEAQCESVVSSMPIYSARTRKNRKWRPAALFGVSPSVVKVYRLLTGIQYSAQEHKAQMLAITGLDEALIERTLNAFGQQPYYSRNYATVVEGTEYNIEELRECLSLIEVALNVELDKSTVNEANFAHMFRGAKLRAEKQMLDALNQAEADLAIGQTIKI